MFIFEKLLKICEAASRLAIWISGVCIFLTSFFICAEVLLRKFFNISSGGVDEISGYALAISFSWALSLTVINKSHIRIDAIYNRLRIGLKASFDCISILALTVYSMVLTFYCGELLRETLALNAKANTTLGTPLWLPQLFWLAGFLLFSFTCALLTILSFVALWRGDTKRISILVGGMTTEEVNAETERRTDRQTCSS